MPNLHDQGRVAGLLLAEALTQLSHGLTVTVTPVGEDVVRLRVGVDRIRISFSPRAASAELELRFHSSDFGIMTSRFEGSYHEELLAGILAGIDAHGLPARVIAGFGKLTSAGRG